jgi:hypothetical protein
MNGQFLDKEEILDIRWAHDDPNPVAQDAITRADKDALYALMKAKGISVENTGFQYPAEYQLPESKRLKLENGVDVIQQNPELAYPNTDGQYADVHTASVSNVSGMTPEEYAIYCAQFYFSQDNNTTVDGAANAEETSAKVTTTETSVAKSNSSSATTQSSDWTEYVDDDSGATYFYNSKTGESVWGTSAPTSS